MARARNIPLGELSGSISGINFSKNKAGAMIRAKSHPVNRNTVKQSENRNRFGASNSTWHTLTDEQKSLWNTKASKLGINGINLLISRQKLLKEYRSCVYSGAENFMRRDGIGNITNITDMLNLSKTPIVRDNLFNFNRGIQQVKSMQLIDLRPTSQVFEFRINFQKTDLNNVLGIQEITYADFMKNSEGLRQAIVIYFRPVLAQKIQSQSDKNYECFMSFPYYERTTNFTALGSFFSRRLNFNLELANFLKKLRLGVEYEFQFRIINEAGNYQVINSQYFTF